MNRLISRFSVTHCRLLAANVKNSVSKQTSANINVSCRQLVSSQGSEEPDFSSVQDDEICYTTSHEDFKWVERLFPPSRVPQPPEHAEYPTASGWIAPSKTIPNKPYFVRRTKYHLLPIYERQKPRRSQRWITTVHQIEGDIFELEKELIEVVRPSLTFDPATRVNELAQIIWIKGLHHAAVEKYLLDLGF